MPKLPDHGLLQLIKRRLPTRRAELEQRLAEHEKAVRKLRRHVNRLDEVVAGLAAPAAAGPESQGDTSFELAIPSPASPLRIDLPTHFYVPQLLRANGLAGYEARSLACWMAILSLPEPGAAYDVGANVGPFAWLAAALSDRTVVAFEPVPELLDAVRSVAADNGIEITTEQIALSDHDGEATFYLSDQTDSSNSLVEGFRRSSRSIDVVVRTLDSYLADTGPAPHALKIDTETNEPEVLRGAHATLAELRPWMIVEVLSGRTETALMDALAGFDYAWYRIDDDLPMTSTDLIVGDPSYEYNNWLLAPHEPDDDFWDAVKGWSDRFARCEPAQPTGLID